MKGMESRLAALERRPQSAASPKARIVIYDPETGLPLPGYEPDSGTGIRIWIPTNGREYEEADRNEP